MTRGQFLASLALLARKSIAAQPTVNAARLRNNLETLSLHGRPAGGTFADGVSRLAYSDADVAGRGYVMNLMKAAGLAPRIDAAGNIFARREGTPNLPAVLFGSHIDSVPNGGNFDGDLGSLSAIEVIRVLNENNLRTRHPLEIVMWANEEGVAFNNGLYGSRAVAGQLDDNEMDVVWRGLKKSDAIRKIGGDPTRLAEARRPAEFFKAYLELHIEQGGNLERAAIPVGIVEGIVAIDDFTIDIKGIANHAGTTPMPDRHDALIAASKLTIAVNEIVKAKPGRQVGTVGELVVEPNARNVVPGRVRMTAEFRDLSESKLDQMGAALRERVKAIAAETGTTIDLQANNRHKAALATPALQEAIGNAASKSGLKTMRLPSGAGHDAQMMARLGPMGMIFVPSIAGISHSPKELTTWEDCARGAQILLDAVLSLAL